jgi:hypothetical protein
MMEVFMTGKHGMRAAACIAIAVLVAAAMPSVDATTLRKMDLADLVGTAERVVHARVVEQRSYWDEGLMQIFTDTTFDVLEEAKGEGPRTLTITLMGGRVGIIDTVVPGSPTFSIGEEAVLFTESRPDGRKHLVGLGQGAMRIIVDEQTGERTAISDAHAGVVYMAAEGGALRPVAAPSPRRAPLPALLDTVRDIAQGRSAPTMSDAPGTPATAPVGRGK